MLWQPIRFAIGIFSAGTLMMLGFIGASVVPNTTFALWTLGISLVGISIIIAS